MGGAKLAVVVVLITSLAGCGGEKKKSPPATTEEVVAAPADAATPPADAARRAPIAREKVELTAAQRKEIRGHMAAGSKLQKAKKWAEAVAAYEAALAIDPSSARAFSELSWVAFQAGEYQKAREAARSSTALTGLPDLKAASLYNEGRAVEALGDIEKAKDIYAESLRLRPNEIVRKRLVGIGGEPPVVTAPPRPCAEPVATKAELSRCLSSGDEGGFGDEVKPVDGLGVMSVWEGDERFETSSYYLYVETAGKFAVAGELARDLALSRWVTSELEVSPIRKEQIGGHTVYRVEAKLTQLEDVDGVSESLDETSLTLCVAGSDGISCPLRIPTERHLIAEAYDEEDEEAMADLEKKYGKRPPIDRRHRLGVEITAEGQVEVALERGAKTAELKRYVGVHRLW